MHNEDDIFEDIDDGGESLQKQPQRAKLESTIPFFSHMKNLIGEDDSGDDKNNDDDDDDEEEEDDDNINEWISKNPNSVASSLNQKKSPGPILKKGRSKKKSQGNPLLMKRYKGEPLPFAMVTSTDPSNSASSRNKAPRNKTNMNDKQKQKQKRRNGKQEDAMYAFLTVALYTVGPFVDSCKK